MVATLNIFLVDEDEDRRPRWSVVSQLLVKNSNYSNRTVFFIIFSVLKNCEMECLSLTSSRNSPAHSPELEDSLLQLFANVEMLYQEVDEERKELESEEIDYFQDSKEEYGTNEFLFEDKSLIEMRKSDSCNDSIYDYPDPNNILCRYITNYSLEELVSSELTPLSDFYKTVSLSPSRKTVIFLKFHELVEYFYVFHLRNLDC